MTMSCACVGSARRAAQRVGEGPRGRGGWRAKRASRQQAREVAQRIASGLVGIAQDGRERGAGSGGGDRDDAAEADDAGVA